MKNFIYLHVWIPTVLGELIEMILEYFLIEFRDLKSKTSLYGYHLWRFWHLMESMIIHKLNGMRLIPYLTLVSTVILFVILHPKWYELVQQNGLGRCKSNKRWITLQSWWFQSWKERKSIQFSKTIRTQYNPVFLK